MVRRSSCPRLAPLACSRSLVACGATPPSVTSRFDIYTTFPWTRSVGARGLPEDAVPALDHLSHLRRIRFGSGRLAHEAVIGDDGLEAIAELHLPHLEWLDFMWCSRITDRGLAAIGRMERIETLFLSGCTGVSDDGLRALRGMESIAYLDLRDMPQLTDDGLAYVADLPSLRRLILSGCIGITDAGLDALSKKTNWREIRLTECWGVSEQKVEELRRRFPEARIASPYGQRTATRADTLIHWGPASDRGPGLHGAPPAASPDPAP